MNNFRFDLLRQNQLQWLPELGIGWFPVAAQPYDGAYWARYRALDKSPSGDALTMTRRSLVAANWDGAVVDVGIGGGKFVADRPQTRGFDVNPNAIDWLKTRGAWCDPHSEQIDAACFWDSLEHIHDPGPILANVRRMVFVSAPIYSGPEHVLRSRHFRRDEHCWYWTQDGIARFMATFGFTVVHEDEREQRCGREDIGSFVFSRK